MTVLWLALLGLTIGFVLGGLGGGGAILTVPALVYVVGETAAQATTTSLVVVGAAAVTGAASHVRSGTVAWRTGLAFGAAGIPAAWAGSHLSHAVDGSVLMLGFSLLMVGAAVAMLRPVAVATPATAPVLATVGAPSAGDLAAPTVSTPECVRCDRWPFVVGAGLAVGLLTGFFGVGGGFVVVPALVLVLGLPMPLAVGTSLVVVAINAATALLARSTTAEFDWAVIVPFALAAMVGALGGRHLADRLPAAQLKRAFAVLLLLVASYTVWHSVADLRQPETSAATAAYVSTS